MGSLLKKRLYCNFVNVLFRKQTCVGNRQRLLSAIVPNGINEPTQLKGRFASYEQKRIVTAFVTESDLTKLDWNALKTSVLSINRGYINEKNINGFILDTCTKEKRLDLAKSFMRHVKERGQTNPNHSLELLYMRSCYASRDQLTDDDRHEIHVNCQSLIKRSLNMLNAVFVEGIVMGLCCTHAWRDSLEVLKSLKQDVTSSTYTIIILRAFEEEDIELGWTMTHHLFNLSRTLPLEVCKAWFELCQKNAKYSPRRVLDFLRDTETVIRKDLAELIRERLKQLGCKVDTTTIYHNNGKCKKCNQHLETVHVTESEFKKLQELFMTSVMIGKNIFNNSSPQELKDFQDFIEMTAPYDVVVDGLNVAYAFRGKIANNSITKVVMNKFIEDKLKVLLIGRKHLVQMLGKEFKFVQNNAHIFFTNDLSKDDPFVLYAAMYSGLGTKVLTRDLMRGHKFLLKDDQMKSVFQKWLQKHRLSLKIRPGNDVSIKIPIAHLQTTQKSNDGTWHIPYQELKEPGSWSKPDTSPDSWMCIQGVN